MILQKIYRIKVYSPPDAVETILKSARDITHLKLGLYEDVAWVSCDDGIEQFRPLEGSHPTVGAINVLEKNHSSRIEFSVPRDELILKKVLEAVIKAHPWEHPVINISEELEFDLAPS